MANVRVDRQKAEYGQLGNACICCGAGAQTVVAHDFYWRPTWFVIMRVVLGRLGRLVFWKGSEYVSCRVPVCSKHAARLRLPTYVGYGVVAWLFLGIIVSLGLTTLERAQENHGHKGGMVAAIFFFPLLVIGPGAVVLQLVTPRAEDFDSGSVSFVAVSPNFAASASGRGGSYGGATSGYGGAPAGYGGQSGYGGTPAGYGSQPSYGAQPTFGSQPGYGGQASGYAAGGGGGLASPDSLFAPAAPRIWTDATGQHRIQATFVRIDGAFIELQRTDGRLIRMQLAQLCQQDQAFARSQSIF